jgi:hypothetical protein
MRTDMDFLVMGNTVVDKKKMSADVKEFSKEEFALD